MSKTSNAKVLMYKKTEVKEEIMRIDLRLKERLTLALVDGFPIILGLGVVVILMVLVGNFLE